MECRLVVKDYNSLYTIYLTKLCKVLVGVVGVVGVVSKVIIVLNFYIYKKLFSLISHVFKIFYPFILGQKALKISCCDLIFNNLYTLIKFIICLLSSV